MEYLKTRRQLPTSISTSTTSSPSHTSSTNLSRSSPASSLHLLRTTIRTSGLRGLYSGCSALVLSNAAKGGVRFISFTQAQRYLSTKTQFGAANPGVASVLAGLVAGATESVLVVTPGEALKTKMIHRQRASGGGAAAAAAVGRSQQSLVRVVVDVVRAEGVRGLWSGLGPVLCKQGTNSAVRFATFGWVQQRWREVWPGAGVGATLGAGAVSGVATT
jgi:solute carrier family 25 (mitochondrial citrate transporter), member 1